MTATTEVTEHKLYKVSGTIMGLGPTENSPQRIYYKYIWIRESNERDLTINQVSATQEMGPLLSPGEAVTLYLVQSPSKHKWLFAIDAGSRQADGIEAIGRDQQKAFRSAIKFLFISIPLCLVLVGLILLPLTIRGLILLSKAPKPKDMRAFLAANRPAAA